MTIDQMVSAVRNAPVRKLVESTPTPDELRSALPSADELRSALPSAGELRAALPSADELRAALVGGLDAVNEGIGTVAEHVDRSAETVRDRIAWAEQLAGRPAPARSGVPRPMVALLGAAAGLAAGLLVSRMDRRTLTTVRERAVSIGSRAARRAGEIGRGVVDRARSTIPSGARIGSPDVNDDALEERARSALGSAPGLHSIRIEVDDGVVTVHGRVEPGGREDALATLRAVPGVRDVEDQLTEDDGAIASGADFASHDGPIGSVSPGRP